MKTTGIIGLKFKDGVPEEIVKKTIERIYTCNKVVIEGMSYHEFGDEKTLSAVLSHVEGLKCENEQEECTLDGFVEGS